MKISNDWTNIVKLCVQFHFLRSIFQGQKSGNVEPSIGCATAAAFACPWPTNQALYYLLISSLFGRLIREVKLGSRVWHATSSRRWTCCDISEAEIARHARTLIGSVDDENQVINVLLWPAISTHYRWEESLSTSHSWHLSRSRATDLSALTSVKYGYCKRT